MMSKMDMKAAQGKISEAIAKDAERVIVMAILFNPGTAEIVEAVRKAPGTIQGVAAAALKDALRGKDHAATVENMIAFAEKL